MIYLILGVVLLALLLWGAKLFVSTDPAKLVPFVRWLALGIGVAASLALMLLFLGSDRIGSALVMACGIAFTGFRAYRAWRYYRGNKGASTVETDLLRMRLDHGTGAMSGEVRRGSYAGRRLEEMELRDLIALWRQCIAEDEAGARLLETYLDRLRPDWRQASSGAGAGAAPGEAMTREQAYAILELAPGASVEAIKDAHHRLMMKLHPDHGGSTFLASQINRAKDILLGA